VSRLPRTALLLALLFTLPLLGACSGLPTPRPFAAKAGKYEMEDIEGTTVGEQLALAEADLDAGNGVDAFLRLRTLWQVPEMTDDARDQAELLLDRSVEPVLAEGLTGRQLKALWKNTLPKRVRVEFGVASAQAYLDRNKRTTAFEMIEKVDAAYLTHHRRVAAGTIVGEAGLSLAYDDSRRFFLFPVKDGAPKILEYLILNYPGAPECPEAYRALTELYEGDYQWETAIQRHRELVKYHPQHPYSVGSEARIPHIRLKRVRRTDYDRSELEVARRELEVWLRRHPGHELEEQVRSDLHESIVRLSDSDMSVARFYRKVDNPFGARLHGDRALFFAREADDTKRIERAERFLASLP
jgi:tetratricopeptide (TPR) repeat protein